MWVLTSSWSKSLSLKFNSERSIVRLSFSLLQISSGCFFLCPTVLKSVLSGKRLIPLGMGGTGFVPFRPLREEGDLTKAGVSGIGVVFSWEFSPVWKTRILYSLIFRVSLSHKYLGCSILKLKSTLSVVKYLHTVWRCSAVIGIVKGWTANS